MCENDLKTAESMKNIGLDPLMQKTTMSLILDIPRRLFALVNKALGIETAFRIVGFYIATVLVMNEKIESYAWLIAAGFLIFGKEFLETLKDLKK